MDKEKKFKPPLLILICDMVGSILVGVGMAAHFGDAHFIPKNFQIENYGFKMIVVGAILFVPFVFYLVRKLSINKVREI